jgi:hypothetical protein
MKSSAFSHGPSPPTTATHTTHPDTVVGGGGGSDMTSASGGGLVHILKSYPRVKEEVRLLKTELKKVAKYAGNIDKHCKESDTSFSFLDQRIEAVGDVASTLNKRFTNHLEERCVVEDPFILFFLINLINSLLQFVMFIVAHI